MFLSAVLSFWQKGGGALILNMRTKANLKVGLNRLLLVANTAKLSVWHMFPSPPQPPNSTSTSSLRQKVSPSRVWKAYWCTRWVITHLIRTASIQRTLTLRTAATATQAHHEERSLQRGGSMSHRRAQSDCLQNRLPITQHFGKVRRRRMEHFFNRCLKPSTGACSPQLDCHSSRSLCFFFLSPLSSPLIFCATHQSRPRRPAQKHRAERDERDMQHTGEPWSGWELSIHPSISLLFLAVTVLDGCESLVEKKKIAFLRPHMRTSLSQLSSQK